MQFQPLEDRVLVRPKKEKEPQKTESGLIDMSKKEVQEATVYSVGPGRYAMENGVFVQTVLHEGDVVLVGAEQGLPIPVTLDDGSREEMKLFREGDILMLISKKESSD